MTIPAPDPRLRIARMTRAAIETTRPGMRNPLLTGALRTAVGRDAFASFVTRVRAQVEAGLAAWLDHRVAAATRRGADVGAVADAVRQLALRGGKRMRPVLLAAAYEACGGEGGSATVAPAGVALELFQAYLLTHDDWMDGDDVRRGGPSVPAMMRERFGAEHGDAMSVLAGDLCRRLVPARAARARLPPARLLRAARGARARRGRGRQGQVLDVGWLGASEAARSRPCTP